MRRVILRAVQSGPISGIINLNKPAGMSSARAVSIVKRMFPRGTKIGHAGTLDPFATGVLLLLIGRATRLCERLMDQSKQYDATIKLGATTTTDDPESPEVITRDIRPVERSQIEQILPRFVGRILQRPPSFSALKVGGRRAYDLARRGTEVTLEPRPVQVYSIEWIAYEWPFARLRVDCGRGTYIRALARDLGQALHVGGYLTQLVRTRVGEFSLEQAVTIEQLQAQTVENHLLPPA